MYTYTLYMYIHTNIYIYSYMHIYILDFKSEVLSVIKTYEWNYYAFGARLVSRKHIRGGNDQ